MLTLFAMPKPFRGNIAVIQCNAIGSWVRLHPSIEVVLFGDEDGTKEVAKEFGIRHVPEITRNEFGTPLVSDLFDRAQRLATHELLCYVNNDIILMDGFRQAVASVSHWKESFLMVGQCWDMEISERVDFDHPEWEKRLTDLVRQIGKARGPRYIDYFVFPRGFYNQLPPFALGRAGFDNWLIWKARAQKAAVVDASCVVVAVHQNHDYSHVPYGRKWSYQGPEASRNLELAGGRKHYYRIHDATHRLTQTGISRHLAGYFRLKDRWENLKVHIGTLWWRIVWWLVELTRPVRHRLGLHMMNVKRIRAYLTHYK